MLANAASAVAQFPMFPREQLSKCLWQQHVAVSGWIHLSLHLHPVKAQGHEYAKPCEVHHRPQITPKYNTTATLHQRRTCVH